MKPARSVLKPIIKHRGSRSKRKLKKESQTTTLKCETYPGLITQDQQAIFPNQPRDRQHRRRCTLDKSLVRLELQGCGSGVTGISCMHIYIRIQLHVVDNPTRANMCNRMCICKHMIYTDIHTSRPPHTHTHPHTCTETHTHTDIHACTHAYQYAYEHTNVTYIHPSIHPSIHACMHACMYACMHACMHTSTQRYVHVVAYALL